MTHEYMKPEEVAEIQRLIDHVGRQYTIGDPIVNIGCHSKEEERLLCNADIWLGRLIADRQALMEENQRLREERDAFKEHRNALVVRNTKLREGLEAAHEREKKLVEALQIIKERSTDYCAVGVANDALKELGLEV